MCAHEVAYLLFVCWCYCMFCTSVYHIDPSHHERQYLSLFSVCGIYGSGLSQGQAFSPVAVQQPLSCRISATRLSCVRLHFKFMSLMSHVDGAHFSSPLPSAVHEASQIVTKLSSKAVSMLRSAVQQRDAWSGHATNVQLVREANGVTDLLHPPVFPCPDLPCVPLIFICSASGVTPSLV